MLSAMFSCPDLPTALLVYREKCAQRLRPRLGGEGQLTSKALLQRSVSPAEIPSEAVPKYHKKISGAYPTAQQKASDMDTEWQSGVTVLDLLWTLLGNAGSTQPCQLLQPPPVSLATLGKHLPLSVTPFARLAIQGYWRSDRNNTALPQGASRVRDPFQEPQSIKESRAVKIHLP